MSDLVGTKSVDFLTHRLIFNLGARWRSGRASDFESRGTGLDQAFKRHRLKGHRVVSLSTAH